jgi:four helix bundle protein
MTTSGSTGHTFAVRVLRLCTRFPRTAVGFTIAGQLSRSSLSIPNNLEEAQAALTEPDTLNKTGIARKEAAETRRALMVVRDIPLLPTSETPELNALIREAHEWVAMLTTGTKRLQSRIQKHHPPRRP